MSVSIAYEPVKEKDYLEGGTSLDVTALEETFGNLPLRLDLDTVPILKAMGAASGRPVYDEIAAILSKHGSVILTAEY